MWIIGVDIGHNGMETDMDTLSNNLTKAIDTKQTQLFICAIAQNTK